jgi:hypothetical protein
MTAARRWSLFKLWPVWYPFIWYASQVKYAQPARYIQMDGHWHPCTEIYSIIIQYNVFNTHDCHLHLECVQTVTCIISRWMGICTLMLRHIQLSYNTMSSTHMTATCISSVFKLWPALYPFIYDPLQVEHVWPVRYIQMDDCHSQLECLRPVTCITSLYLESLTGRVCLTCSVYPDGWTSASWYWDILHYHRIQYVQTLLDLVPPPTCDFPMDWGSGNREEEWNPGQNSIVNTIQGWQYVGHSASGSITKPTANNTHGEHCW